jgi:RNA polymerase sigma-70 factor, ECF subfamily
LKRRSGAGQVRLQFKLRAALHCQATRTEDTDWAQIVQLYEVMERLYPFPIVSLNRAVALAMVEGSEVAIALLDQLTAELDSYHLFHAARADLSRRIGNFETAAQSYARALEIATNDSERRFLKLWSKYLTNWTLWNHVRTVAALISTLLFTIALGK